MQWGEIFSQILPFSCVLTVIFCLEMTDIYYNDLCFNIVLKLKIDYT